jgi:hypothetical protein
MKLCAFVLCTLIFLQASITNAFEYSERQIVETKSALADWEKSIEIAKKENQPGNIKMLSEGVRKLSRKKSLFSDWRNELYLAAREQLLATPGHAEHAREEIEKARLSLGSLIYEVGYSNTRRLQFETLAHLPSPETIKVLGDYLADDRDLAKEPVWFPDGGLAGLDANSWWSVRTLGSIGLRDTEYPPPDVGKRPRFEDYAIRDEAWRDIWHYEYDKRRKELGPWRAWYAEVKSGQRAFSFNGQAVEYRFNPDGTWQTISIPKPPDDAPEITEARTAATRAVKQRAKEQPPGNADRAYRPYLLAGLAGLLALAAAWFALQRTKAAT